MAAILNFKKCPQWKSLNCHNSKYIDEESTKIGTNKLYDSILPVGNNMNKDAILTVNAVEEIGQRQFSEFVEDRLKVHPTNH